MKKILTICVILLAAAAVFAGQATVTLEFTDSCGRTVSIPAGVNKIAPSGSVATMILSALCPEYLCSVNDRPTANQIKYLPKEIAHLPVTGQLYGGKSTINAEQILATGAQLIIDMGDKKNGIAEDLDKLQKQTGIPCIFLEADLPHMAKAFENLGKITGKRARAQKLAAYISETVSMAEKNRRKIKESEKISVMYTTGKDGLGTNAKGSSQAQVIEIVGAENAVIVDKVNSKGGGNRINMEQLYRFNPDVIIFTEDSIWESVGRNKNWQILDAVKNGKCYEIPSAPYNWMSGPPSMNMILGIKWLGNLLYPQYYDYDMKAAAKEFYGLFWNYSLTDEETAALLSRSTELN